METFNRILIIDDEESICWLLGKLFNENGFETESALTGKEALDKLSKTFFNIALLDINLPDIEGISLVESFKKIQGDIEIVLITGYASVDTAIQALNKGVYAYIKKPIKTGDLLIIVKNIITKQKLINDKRRTEQKLRESKDNLEKEVKKRTKELEVALEQQKLYLDQILEASKSKTEFMAIMSHELRTPLNSIIGFTDLILEGSYGHLSEVQSDFLYDIKNSSLHLLNLINNILEISEIEAGQLNLNFQEFSLNNTINEVVNIIKPIYSKKQLKFTVKLLEDELMIYADPVRFKEVLLNLLDNSIKFTNNGEITLIIDEKNDNWIFSVRDTGIGIAKDNYSLIFQPFKRIITPENISSTGSGLGLSLAKRLVELHNGQIWYESEENRGSTFYFTIPKKSENKYKK